MNGSYVTGSLALLFAISFNINSAHAQADGYAVTERGPDYKVLEKTALENGTNYIHRYIELATGLNYTNSYGQLTEAQEQITLLSTGGAAATQGRHQVYFPADIYNGVIEVVTLDGRHLKSRPLGVSYDDGSNTVFIATLKHAQGYLTSSNTVTYRDAFNEFKADIVATYRRGGFECDLVFRQQPPTPDQFGLDNSFAALQLVTEFFDTQDPQEIPAQSDDWCGLQDTTLKFGKLTMTHGKAFAIKPNSQLPATNSSATVYKSWVHLEGRTFLIESVPLMDIAENLDALPLTASLTNPKSSIPLLASAHSFFPPAHEFVADTNQILLAAGINQQPGVVLDYNEINDDPVGDFTFQSGTTYLVSANVVFHGNTTIQGGAVLKFNDSGCLYPEADDLITCPTNLDFPAVLTSVDDNSVGEPIDSGSPVVNNATYISFQDNPALAQCAISNLRVSYAGCGIQDDFEDGYVPLKVSHSQFINCGSAFHSFAPEIIFQNVLFHGCGIVIEGGGGFTVDVQATHTTADQCGMLIRDDGVMGDSVELTNSILSLVTNMTSFSSPSYDYLYALYPQYLAQVTLQNSLVAGTNRHATIVHSQSSYQISNATGLYQTGGSADFYLATSSSYRDVGTTNINAGLLAAFQTMTTYAPQDGGWPDTNAPDWGYHYPVNEDSDHNGLPDWWELKYFNQIGVDPNADPDDDGLSNIQEFLAGSNPLSSTMVLAWGDNSFGECSVPAGLTNAIAVAGGGDGYPPIKSGYSIALKADGSVLAWGNSNVISHGETNVPSGLVGVTNIAVGSYHSLALCTNGGITSWGAWKGPDGSFLTVAVPVECTNVIGIAAGLDHDLAVRADGKVIAWGYNTNATHVIVPTNLLLVKAVAAGWAHSVVLQTNGTIRMWGTGAHAVPDDLTNVVAIAAGPYHTLALKADKTVVAIGDTNDYTYDSYQQESTVPVGLSNVVAIAAGYHYSMALKSDGTVVMWGNYLRLPSYPLNQIKAIGSGWLHGLAIRGSPLTPVIVTQPTSQAVLPGANVSFSIQALALAEINYQWQSNSVNISGATNNTFSLTSVKTNAAATYRVAVSNKAGSFISSNAVLTVYDVTLPVIVSVSLPTNPIVTYSSNLTLGVVATANGAAVGFPLAYQWRTNSGKVIGATASNFTFTVLGSQTYSVTISNALGGTNASWVVTAYYPGGVLIPQQPTNQYQIAGSNVTFVGTGVGSNALRFQWTFNGTNIAGATNSSLTLSNVSAAQQGNYGYLLTDGTNSLTSSNASFTLVTSPVVTSQTSPTNRICIEGNYLGFAATANAPGMTNGFPLRYQWQFNGTNIVGATSTNYSTTASNAGIYSIVITNLAGSTNASWQVTMTNAISVTNDLLLIYNTNSADSAMVLNYYLAHRPGVSGANVLGVSCPGFYVTNAPADDGVFFGLTNVTDYEAVNLIDLTNQILNPVQNWLTANPTKRPQYVVLFPDIPSRVNTLSVQVAYNESSTQPSVQYQLHTDFAGWNPYVTSINMKDTNDCIGYINKLEYFGTNYSPGKLIIGASAASYGNTNWYFDDAGGYGLHGLEALQGTMSNGVSSSAIIYSTSTHIYGGTNVVGYYSKGHDGGLGLNYSGLTNNGLSVVIFQGNSGWYLINTIDSYNGQRYGGPGFIQWFSANAFGGTDYSNTPIGAVTTVDEPTQPGKNDNFIYFGLWAAGKNFLICAWNSDNSPYFQAVGDPFITK